MLNADIITSQVNGQIVNLNWRPQLLKLENGINLDGYYDLSEYQI